jgi:hypothetical protein
MESPGFCPHQAVRKHLKLPPRWHQRRPTRELGLPSLPNGNKILKEGYSWYSSSTTSWYYFITIFETGSHCAAQAALRLEILLGLPPKGWIIAIRHHTRPEKCIFKSRFFHILMTWPWASEKNKPYTQEAVGRIKENSVTPYKKTCPSPTPGRGWCKPQHQTSRIANLSGTSVTVGTGEPSLNSLGGQSWFQVC